MYICDRNCDSKFLQVVSIAFTTLTIIIAALLLGFRLSTNSYHNETYRTFNLHLSTREEKTSNIVYRKKELIIKSIDPNETNKSIDSGRTVLPTYDSYEAMLEDDTHASTSRSFPGISMCPYQGLRKPLVNNIFKKTKILKCHRRPITSNDCAEMVQYFGQHGSMKAGKCDTNNSIKICTVLKKNTNKREDIQISCDVSPCKGKKVSLGLFSDTTGKIKWRVTKDINHISRLIRHHILFSALASGFALLKCGQGIQILNFPKILKQDKSSLSQGKKRLFNINIVVEDSLSRTHFYRTLLKTASTLRDIIYNQSIPSTVLEFDKVQSYASSTYYILQKLFTGEKYMTSKTNCEYGVEEFLVNDTKYSCTYGFEEMFNQYKRAGYSTLFQEDNCWFDVWGSFMEPRAQLPPVKDESMRLRRWIDFVKLVKKSGRREAVDDYGISLLSCDVYKRYNATNQFSSKALPNVCFAGDHFSSLVLDYVKKYIELNDMAAQPFIAYTHLLTSHDSDGKRIVNDDERLAELFRHSAHLRNTVTIFASDHGAKATRFAAYTTQGRQEVFQPLLFIIIPHEVTKLLGPDVMNSLVMNQHRLVGIEDLHHSLVSILDNNSNISRTNADNYELQEDPNVEIIPTRLRGLFQPVPLDRTCEQMKLHSDVLCLCEGMDKTVSNDSYQVQWAAEFALGTLNNRIQEQYTKALKSKPEEVQASAFYGYGACQRYAGAGVMRARQVVTDSEQKLFFSLLLKPLERKTVEIFDVEVSFAMKQNANGITLNNLIRVSPFNEYEKCADESVDPRLCACDADQQNNTQWRNELFSKAASQENFKLKSETLFFDVPCLAIISRVQRENVGGGEWRKVIATYEAVNACPDVMYELSVRFSKAWRTRVSLRHPGSVMLLPRTVKFLLTAHIEWKFDNFIPKFTFKKSNLTFHPNWRHVSQDS